MTQAFDSIAPRYGSLWTETPDGRSQRAAVWRELDRLFKPGDRVLDLGCGIGDDALHLKQRGTEVLGIDASQRMVEIAQTRGVAARQLAIEVLDQLSGVFSGAISNFGALNCVADLRAVGKQLARLIQPGGALAICIMGRFCWWETVRFLWTLDWHRATRRWSGHAQWREMEVHYFTSREIRSAFAPCFRLDRRISVGRGDHQLYILTRRTEC